ncbi:substrate-binding periplasmic protein [Andreprevotia chitinilytica]|uniref:substrate-binding periplasmic protein n=1 Tax=Andreprevotia chitinilytica TaxID=396808 RepID=UPI00068FD07C|nr:transporter substrate-binding domain-containing protein [Andreprevotia chitinilytica]
MFKAVVMTLALLAAEATPAAGCPADQPCRITLSNGEWPPFFSEHLKGGGIFSRLVVEAYQQQGITVVYGYRPWVRAYSEAQAGEFDGTVGLAPNPERLNSFLFSDPVVYVEMVFFHRRGRHFSWNTLADLSPYLIGTTRGNFYSDEFDRLHKAGKLRVDESANEEVFNFRKLLNGRVDLFPIDRHVGEYLLKTRFTPQEREQLTYDHKVFWKAPLHLLISRRAKNGPQLISVFNQGLQKMKSSGEYQRIVDDKP